ncbi:hypothetical protein BU17DRAFT_75097 [Hysterangium stoloniferum]|nr:hypothetical protein BU17DRAFT_75097 [Hysterangium stoloniferum]
MWLLGVGLANTSSGSFLVTKAHVTHLEMKRAIHPPVLECVPGKIATPDWSLLDKHALLSKFTCSALEMNHTLHEKEKGKKSDRTILFPGGKGRHLTDVELIKQKRELEDTKAQEEAEKERKRANLEECWKAMLEEYEHTITEWTTGCQTLRAAGVKVKDLPKKPKRPTKPKLTELGDNDEGQDDVDDDGS